MSSPPEKVVFDWLRKLKIQVSFRYFETSLCSHYAYPSLLSITDTLDKFGITNAAFVIDKENLNELPTPFLIHSETDGGKFTIVNDVASLTRPTTNELKNWNGIVLAAEKSENWENKENETWLKKEKSQQWISWGVIGIATILSLSVLSDSYSLSTGGLLLSSFAGFFISVYITQYEMGYTNQIADQICRIKKSADCSSVINSEGSKLLKWFTWADTGIIYFTTLYFSLLVSLLSNHYENIIALFSLLSIFSLPFTFFSLYYQKWVIKKWCVLCLITITILWIQSALLLTKLLSISEFSFTYSGLLLIVVVFIAVGLIWLSLLKPTLKQLKETKRKNFSLIRFKNTPDIFDILLMQQREVDVEPLPFDNDLQLGNPNAPVQLMAVCNPFCEPCAQAHVRLHQLLEKNNFGLTVRFAINANEENNDKVKAVEYILKCRKTCGNDKGLYNRKLLYDWFMKMDLKEFTTLYTPWESSDVSRLLSTHIDWTEKSKIQFTPTIFINGRELPTQYQIKDFIYILPALLNKFESVNYKEKVSID